ncbi:MAG: hypothetical protein JWP13_220 [Candidatus Saccharibacteria bacterium]|nr:hypothetical protein [Candidatus Saccharibacteria bacterium]
MDVLPNHLRDGPTDAKARHNRLRITAEVVRSGNPIPIARPHCPEVAGIIATATALSLSETNLDRPVNPITDIENT